MTRAAEPMLPTLKYVDICEELRRRIKAGVHKPGDRLPSQVRLAQEFGVALLTLRQALQLLESLGYLYRKSGSGTYVARPKPPCLTALVVDDDESIREALRTRLVRMGWSVETAGNGEEGLRLMERVKVDLIFLDLVMPGMDGAEAFRKTHELDADIPVVIVTAYPESELMARALRVGPFAVVRKPFRASDIQSIVKSLFGAAAVIGKRTS